MIWPYQYTPDTWPMLASACFMFVLAFYIWRHRATPGAAYFATGVALAALWALGNAFELSATDQASRFWWFRFQMAVSTPAAAMGTCFVLQYAGLGRWLTRPGLALLIVPNILSLPVYLLDDARLLWSQIEYLDDRFVRTLTPLGVVWNLYGLAILSLAVVVALALFVRSPHYRRPAALMTLGHMAIVSAQVIVMAHLAPAAPVDLMIMAIDFAFAMYAIALFRYRLFDVVPVARDSAVERMPDPMVVLDASNRVADLNLAAQQLLGLRRARTLGKEAAQALAAVPGLAALVGCHTLAEGEVALGEGSTRRWYRVTTSPLDDGRGFHLGCLLVLHETTQLKLTQERLLQQERAVATLREREHLARELHDGVGQVLGYVSLQTEAARKLLDDGKANAAGHHLAGLARVARDAHADVREYILSLRATPSEQRPFFQALSHYLQGYAQNYGVATSLTVPPALDEGSLASETKAQLFRIIQEALSNARQHGGARRVKVAFALVEGLGRVEVEDDGAGFDPAAAAGGDGLGLQFMRERAEQVGGRVEIQSVPGRGTRVVVSVPLSEPQTA
ncbi:MAG: sensor histidine kinase [Chloroflexota bacterium]